MQQKNPWDEDWSQPQSAPTGGGGYPTITMQRDPRQVAREDDATARARAADQRSRDAAARDAARFAERNKPNLPAGYVMGPDGRTAMRVPGLPPEKGAEQTGNLDFESVRAEALDKIRLARTLQGRSKNGWFTTGLGANLAAAVGGTPAYDVRQDTETLKNAGALTRIMEMARTNGGKNPLTPLSNADFQALSSSLANLDTSQSDGQYQTNVQRVIELYSRAYKGAGGADLEGDLDPTKRRRTDAGANNRAPTGGNSGPPMPFDPMSGPASDPNRPSGLATGKTRSELLPEANAIIDQGVRAGRPLREVNAALVAKGFNPQQDAKKYNEAVQWFRKHPGYQGGFGNATRVVPTTAWNRFAASPVGTGIYAGVDAAAAGMTDEFASLVGGGDLADLNARKQAAFAANPKAAFTGQVAGAIGAMSGLGVLGRTTGLASRVANPALVADVGYGTVYGAGQSNDNRVLGTALGAVGGVAGNVLGNVAARGVGAAARTGVGTAITNRARGLVGKPVLPTAPPLSPADRTLLNALNKAGPDDVTRQLAEAESLAVPMSLADTNPNLRELAGAAVRRSPTAAQVAEDALTARSRGQYDRFTSAVERNLGPTANIPQRSADLMADARTAASDLYDQAYRNPVPSTPELDATLGTPFGRQALGRARTIAANERRNPEEMGFALDADGNVVLNPQPNRAIADHLYARAELDAAQDAYRAARGSPGADLDGARLRVETAREGLRQAQQAQNAAPDPTVAASVPTYTTQTLDYVKRGMDDVLEEQRNPITGRLVLDEAGRAQNQVRGQMLSEVDRLNPDFAAAREAYAGPMASRDALGRGGDAYGLHPDELGIQVGNQTPEHLEQMRLGYRGAMVDHAGRVRDNSNPWESTLGSPVARDRLTTMYPDNPGVDRMMRLLDLERTMAQTRDAVTGNSKTAGRQIMDKVFEGGGWPVAAAEAGLAVLTQGATLPLAARRLAGEGARDMYRLGVGARATAKAEELAPMLLGTNPVTAAATAQRLLAQEQALQRLIEASTPKRGFGLFGRALGSQAAVAPLNQ